MVSLDGSASFDLDHDYPLSFVWQVLSSPLGSVASLSEPTTAAPFFTADLPGDYIVQLLVYDSLGLVSPADTVLVSTWNSAPSPTPAPTRP